MLPMNFIEGASASDNLGTSHGHCVLEIETDQA